MVLHAFIILFTFIIWSGGAGDEGQTSLQEKIPPKEKRARRSPEGGGRSSSTSQADPSPEPCGHKNSGQELCYLCYQRASRNVPVNFDSEKREHDYVQNQILLEYQKHQQALHLARERVRQQHRFFGIVQSVQTVYWVYKYSQPCLVLQCPDTRRRGGGNYLD